MMLLLGCEGSRGSGAAAAPPDEPSPLFRNVATTTAYAGDATCSTCHQQESAAYRQHAMSQSFHRWTPVTRIETTLAQPKHSAQTGFDYTVVEDGHQLYQVEALVGPTGARLHELRRRIDYVMGSGAVARSYFTEENGRLFQLPLTWYRERGWDFSPGYQHTNGRFDRVLPDRCIACHSSYPEAAPNLEGKYTTLREGIGCERCHGPGALHVAERRAGVKREGTYDNTIVNPARLPLQRRVDVCEQCHVHTSVSVLREDKTAFSYLASQLVRDQWAFFRVSGSIDIVSHADRLRQSKCFIATRTAPRPLECASCHNPHQPPLDVHSRNAPCMGCHTTTLLQQRLERSPSRADHVQASDCVSCHMPRVQERAVHGAFTEHWIRVPQPGADRPSPKAYADGPIEPYFDRDRAGPDAKVYQGMGEIVYANLSNDRHVLADGVAALDSALGTNSTHADAHFLLGVANQQLGMTDDAIRALERSVRIDSSRPEPLRALAQSYQRAGRAPAEIYRLYERALRLQPALAWMRSEYADYLQAQGRAPDAIRAYRAALAEQPSLAVSWFNLGTVLVAENRQRESSDAFLHAVRLDPALAQGLSSLIRIRTSGVAVTSVQQLGAPIAPLPLGAQRAGAVRVAVDSGASGAGLRFIAVPSRGAVEILMPDGTPVRSLPTGAGDTVRWDLLTDAGSPVSGGLYRVRVRGMDASGRAAPTQLLYIGMVRSQ